MVAALILSTVIIALAFSVGFAIRRASICAVAAARQSAKGRRHTRMIAFLTAACWAGAVLLPAAWIAPDAAILSPGYPITLGVVAGGALFGLGAYVNGACAFGTLSHLSGGEMNYTGTLVGAFIGAGLAAIIPYHPAAPAASTLSIATGAGLLLFLAFSGVAAAATRRYYRGRRRRKRRNKANSRLGAATALLIIGAGGALLHATAGEWTYMAVLSDRAATLVSGDASGAGLTVLIGSGALIAGGVYAARRSGRFRWRPLEAGKFGQRVVGGAMMSFAAAIVPGGNDVMLLYGVPSAAPHAIAAYVAMMAVLYGVFRIRKLLGNASDPSRRKHDESQNPPLFMGSHGEPAP